MVKNKNGASERKNGDEKTFVGARLGTELFGMFERSREVASAAQGYDLSKTAFLKLALTKYLRVQPVKGKGE